MCTHAGIMPLALLVAIRNHIAKDPDFYQKLPIHFEPGVEYPALDAKAYFEYWNSSLPPALQIAFPCKKGVYRETDFSAEEKAKSGARPDHHSEGKREQEEPEEDDNLRTAGFSAASAAAAAAQVPNAAPPSAHPAPTRTREKSGDLIIQLPRPSWYTGKDSMAQAGKRTQEVARSLAWKAGTWVAMPVGFIGGAALGGGLGLKVGAEYPLQKAGSMNNLVATALATTSTPFSAVAGGAIGAMGGAFVGATEAIAVTINADNSAWEKAETLGSLYLATDDLSSFFSDPLASRIFISDASERTSRFPDIRSEKPFPRTLAGIQARCQNLAAEKTYQAVARTLAFLSEQLGRKSLDDQGKIIIASIHYPDPELDGRKNWANAAWDPVREQLIIGDGDGRVSAPFGHDLSTIAHEIFHGVTHHCIGLQYRGEPGALDEHISDVFGMLVNQKDKWESHSSKLTDDEIWYIGKDLFLPTYRQALQDAEGGHFIHALRSMKEPGTAFSGPGGRDGQVSHMDDYVRTSLDQGGVHTNSGIPNKAFYLFVMGLGDEALKTAGTIWYKTITSGKLTQKATFQDFATETLSQVSPEHKPALRSAWGRVGILQPNS